MAQRRMFSLKIIDTDVFLDMPLSAQALYFHLSMRADDDGFVSSPKRILKTISCSEDDFKILLMKQFILPFESGICVIKDWKIHNYIQKDRYTPSIYNEEKSMLLEDKNGSYTKCIQNVYTVDTQVRLEIELEKELEIDKEIDFKEIEKLWNGQPRLNKIKGITKERKKKTILRIKENSLEEFLTAIKKINDSDFATGNNKDGWIANFDWLVQNENNIVKVLEGNYDNKKNKQQPLKPIETKGIDLNGEEIILY